MTCLDWAVSSTFDILKEKLSQRGIKWRKAKFNYLLIHLTWFQWSSLNMKSHRHEYFSDFRRSIVAPQQISPYLWITDIVQADNLPLLHPKTIRLYEIRQFFMQRTSKTNIIWNGMKSKPTEFRSKYSEWDRDKDVERLMRNGNVMLLLTQCHQIQI